MDGASADSRETHDLLERARAGDRQAVELLLARHRPFLKEMVELRMDPKLRPRVDPSDLVQEAQFEASRRLDGYLAKPELPFRLWLRQLAYDRLLMARRRHLKASRRSIDQEVALPERSSLLLAQRLMAGGSTPSQKMVREELAIRVRQAVARLTEIDREVLLMRTFEGLSFEEVAVLLGIESAAAQKRHGRALLRLHQLLTETGLRGASDE